jgi:hypothetical protein
MAILWARKKLTRRSEIDDRGQQSFYSEYTLKSDTPNESRSVVLGCGLLPVYGAPHPENPLAVCVRVAADKNRQQPHLWDAAAEWRMNPASKRDPADHQKQPDQRRPKWSCKFVEIPCQRFTDVFGKHLCSSAGQPFDPVPDIPIIADEISVVRYEAQCRRGFQRSFMDKANAVTWFGAEAGTALVTDISVQEEYLQGAYWFLTSYRILIKPRIMITLPLGHVEWIGGWEPEKILDLGTLKKEVADGKTKIVPITRTDPITKKPFYDGRPAFLDGNGNELARDEATGLYTADPVFLTFHMKKQIDFTPLELVPPAGMTAD